MLSREEVQAKRDAIIKFIIYMIFEDSSSIYGVDNAFVSISRRDLEDATYDPLVINILRELERRDFSLGFETLQAGNNLIYNIEENTINIKHCVLIKNNRQVRTKITIEYNIIKEYDNCVVTTKDKEIKFTL